MIRERSEIIAFTRDDLERIARYVAKERVIGSLFIGKFGNQTARWMPDGGMEVITTYQEGDWSDVPELPPREDTDYPVAPIEMPGKKRRK